jgi:hypothetical protein
MDINNHKKVLGIFYIVFGILNILFAVMGYFLIWRIFEFAHVPDEVYYIARIIGASFGVMLLLSSVLSIIGGAAMVRHKSWARILLLILGCVYLFLFPIGTILGIYTIVIFLSEKESNNQAYTQSPEVK